MTSFELKTFITVVGCGSFNKAAQPLYITPAAVMKQVNALESRLGITLFCRSRKGVELTEAGRHIYAQGQKLLELAEKAVNQAKNIASDSEATIRIGSSFLNPGNVLIRLWKPLHDIYPQYKFSIVPIDDDSGKILHLVASIGNRFDVMIGCLNSNKMQEYCNYLELGAYNLCIAVPRRHRLATRNIVKLLDFHDEKLIMVKSGDAYALESVRHMLEKYHPQIQIKDTGYYYDLETFNRCEREDICLLTLDAWADIHPSLITLQVDWDFKVPYGILYSKNPPQHISRFVDILKDHFLRKHTE